MSIIDLNNEERDVVTTGVGGVMEVGDICAAPEDSGSVLSLALKLRNRNMGTSQTHVAKNVAMSAKPGACGVFEGAP